MSDYGLRSLKTEEGKTLLLSRALFQKRMYRGKRNSYFNVITTEETDDNSDECEG